MKELRPWVYGCPDLQGAAWCRNREDRKFIHLSWDFPAAFTGSKRRAMGGSRGRGWVVASEAGVRHPEERVWEEGTLWGGVGNQGGRRLKRSG